MRDDKIRYYGDETEEDFAGSRNLTRERHVNGRYRYSHGILWRAASWFLYRCAATPVAYCWCRHRFGVRIKNRRALRGLEGGYFLYGNHTMSAGDAFLPTLLTFPRRCDIVVGGEAVSLPVVRTLVPMLGGIPLASTTLAARNFIRTLSDRIDDGRAVVIYPEAHIWPYYNGIRDFPDSSFAYPLRLGVPAVGFTVTYRRRKLFPKAHPHITVTLSDPIMPGDVENRTELRNLIHDFMTDTVAREGSVAYIHYEKKPEKTIHE